MAFCSSILKVDYLCWAACQNDNQHNRSMQFHLKLIDWKNIPATAGCTCVFFFFAKQYKLELNALWDCAAGLNSLHCFAMFLWNSNNPLIWEIGCFLIRCVTRFILRDLFCAFLTTYNQHQWENYLNPQLCNKMHSFKKRQKKEFWQA